MRKVFSISATGDYQYVFFKFVFASEKKRNNKITFLITVLQYCKLPPYMSQLFSKPSILIHLKKKEKTGAAKSFPCQVRSYRSWKKCNILLFFKN